MPITRFFATKADMIPGLAVAERKLGIHFARQMVYDNKSFDDLHSLLNVPSLGISRTGNQASDDVYLFQATKFPFVGEEFELEGGIGKLHIHPGVNPHTVQFTPGGLFGSSCVVSGHIWLDRSHSQVALLYREFAKYVTMGFRSVQGYRIGKEALAIYEAGGRLVTRSVGDPGGDFRPQFKFVAKPPAMDVGTLGGQRYSYEDSCKALQRLHLLGAGRIPPLPGQMPRYDDYEPLGVEFFRAELADVSLEKLSLPRTYFGHSEIRDVSFRGSDLSESVANWNDFTNVDFSLADLSHCDLRSCCFDKVQFKHSILRGVDFRHCSFQNCNFEGADLMGAKLAKATVTKLRLSAAQRSTIVLRKVNGPDPPG
ncbi:MAG: pentapeptide repeat-containing protein [Verrucomicrobiota bacterium]